MSELITEYEVDPKLISNKIYMIEVIAEAIKSSFPESLHKKLSLTSTRKQMLADFGPKAFLDPDNLKYPIINPFTKKVDCRLIVAAKKRAAQYHRENILKKAEKAYQDNKCESTVKLKVAKESIDVEDAFIFFELEETSKDINNRKEEYQKIVRETMQKYGIKKISDLKDKETKRKFFDELDSKWTSKREEQGLDQD